MRKNLKHRSENFLRFALKETYKNPFKTHWMSNNSALTADVARYLQSKDLVDLDRYYDLNVGINLKPKAYCYFQDKKDSFTNKIVFGLFVPIVVSVLGTFATISLTNWLN